jgi:beta-mannosidase
VNASLKDRKASVELECVDLKPNCSSWKSSTVLSETITLPANKATEISNLDCPSNPESKDATVGGFYPIPVDDNTTTYTIVACVRIRDQENGQLLARAVDWPQPYRYLTWYAEQVDPQITIKGKLAGDEEVLLEISSERPVKALFLTLDLIRPLEGGALDWDYEKVRWSDNALDLMPGETIQISVRGPGVSKESMKELNAAWLGREKKDRITVTWL